MSTIDPIYSELAQKLKGEQTEYIPRILARLASLEQAKIMKALPDGDRARDAGKGLDISPGFAERLGMDKDTIALHIQELYEKGVVFPTKAGPQMARTVLQLHDSSLANPKYDDALGDEFFKLWALSEGQPRKPKKVSPRPGSSVFRVVPKWNAIKDIPGVLPFEDTRAILRAQEILVVIPCGCKRSYKERDCGTSEEVCITVGSAARYNLDRGVGKKITYEEALELLEKIEQEPLIPLTMNKKEVNNLLCNCHWCCCPTFETAAKSRFQAAVKNSDCTGCSICQEQCQFAAIDMKTDAQSGELIAVIDPEICRGCGDCVIHCPDRAIEMKLIRPPEHVPEQMSIY
jgi:Pyruvate/2-oxoacid:ferredoxin oxidoreductase delta subunit